MSELLKCPFCGYIFDEKQAKKGCSGCPFGRFCHRIKCPNCGFEIVPLPELSAKEQKK